MRRSLCAIISRPHRSLQVPLSLALGLVALISPEADGTFAIPSPVARAAGANLAVTSTDPWDDLTGLLQMICWIVNCSAEPGGAAPRPTSGDPEHDAALGLIDDQIAAYEREGIRPDLTDLERTRAIASVIELQTFLEEHLDLLPEDLTLTFYATLEDIRNDLSQ